MMQRIAATLAVLLTLIGHARAESIQVTPTASDTYVVALATEAVFDTLVIGIDGDVSDGVNVVPFDEQLGARVIVSSTDDLRLLTPLGAPENEGVFEPGITHAIDLTYGVTTPVPGEWIDGLAGTPFLEFRLLSGVATASIDLFYEGQSVSSRTVHVPPPTVPGDYNDDGVVNVADYFVWRDNLGATGIALAADGDGSGTVDEVDYNIWRDNFGSTAAALNTIQSAVPEPTTWNLFLLGLCSLRGIRGARSGIALFRSASQEYPWKLHG